MWLYRTQSIGRATIWTILGGYLLLPVGVGIKFEMIPALEKNTIPVFAALAGSILVLRRLPRAWTKFGLTEIIIMVLVFSPVVTSILNGDPVRVADRELPGVGLYDGLSAAISQILVIIPFILGRQLLHNPADSEDILRCLAVAGLLYSLPMIFEIRMSPQLHTWIYGFFPHSFLQQVRDGGYRPVVFLGHGLWVAFFAMTTVVASAALWQLRVRIKSLPPIIVTAYLSVILVLCKSAGAMIYGALLTPLVRFTSPRTQLRVALLLVCGALLYPTLRATDLVPTEAMLSLATFVSTDRSQSLETRFIQEKELLEHASQRLLFGWGRWGRNRIVDQETGRDASITDGLWILTLGQFGYVGFIAQFGLLALTILRAANALSSVETTRSKTLLAALALIVAINVVDQLPNATIGPWTWLIAGALLGRAEQAIRIPADARQTLVVPA
jgi:hypothetical protein